MTTVRPAILHVISGLRTGGAERSLFGLVEHGLSDAFDTHVVSMESEGVFGPRLREAGATVHVLNMARNPVSALARLRRVVHQVKPDLLQGWMYHGNLGAYAARKMAAHPVPVLWNIRQGLDDLSLEKPATRQVIRLNRMLSKAPDRIIYNSRRSRGQHEAFGLSGMRSLTISNGFDLDRFQFDEAARHRIRSELGVGPVAVLIGHFARFHPMKDHAGLLKAANIAFRNGLDAHFLLAGSGVSADSVELHLHVDPDFRRRFHIFGDRADVPAMMQAVDLYVSSSSSSEGFPNVVGEAMATGKPCIGTDVGDTAHVIGDTGIVVAPSDPSALALALKTLSDKPDLRHELGAAAQNVVRSKFDINIVVRGYIDLYHNVLTSRRGSQSCAAL